MSPRTPVLFPFHFPTTSLRVVRGPAALASTSEAPLLLSRGSEHKEVPDEAGGKRPWWREAAEEAGRRAARAAPMIAGARLQLWMQLISTVMVGHLGEVALAGAAIANSLTNGSGFSVLVSSLPPTPLSVCHSFHIFCLHFLHHEIVRASRESPRANGR